MIREDYSIALTISSSAKRLSRDSCSRFCAWKGVARYLAVLAGSATASRASWAYDNPTARFADLAGHVAFYAAQMDETWVGDGRVIPEPGNF